MNNEERKEQIKKQLGVEISEDSGILDKNKDTFGTEETMCLQQPDINNLEKHNLYREEFIENKKKEILKYINRRDPIAILLSEKLAGTLYSLEYLDKKYGNSIIISGKSSNANKFLMELEYTRTLLLQQMTILCNSLAFSEEDLENIRINREEIQTDRTITSVAHKYNRQKK